MAGEWGRLGRVSSDLGARHGLMLVALLLMLLAMVAAP